MFAQQLAALFVTKPLHHLGVADEISEEHGAECRIAIALRERCAGGCIRRGKCLDPSSTSAVSPNVYG